MRIIVLVVNLERRPDRRAWIEQSIAVPAGDELVVLQAVDGRSAQGGGDGGSVTLKHHGFEFAAARGWALTATELVALEHRWKSELGYTPPDTRDLEEFYGRPVNSGELACFASHHEAWVIAAKRLGVSGRMRSDEGEEWAVVVLEDDVTVLPCPEPRLHLHRSRWLHVLDTVRREMEALQTRQIAWDLLYLGRNLHGHDRPLHATSLPGQGGGVTAAGVWAEWGGERLCRAGFSTCAHAYAVSAAGLAKLLSLSLHEQVMPVDDILPALYSEHPRQDINRHVTSLLAPRPSPWAHAPPSQRGEMDPYFCALAFCKNLVWQLESVITEPEEGGMGGGGGRDRGLLNSDITGSSLVGIAHITSECGAGQGQRRAGAGGFAVDVDDGLKAWRGGGGWGSGGVVNNGKDGGKNNECYSTRGTLLGMLSAELVVCVCCFVGLETQVRGGREGGREGGRGGRGGGVEKNAREREGERKRERERVSVVDCSWVSAVDCSWVSVVNCSWAGLAVQT
jgi:glycosyl transferase, family 25